MQAMGVADVRAALDKLGLEAEIRQFDSSTATSQQAAQAVGCQLGQIVKSLGFMINKTQPLLVLVSGDQSVDDRKLAAHCGVGRKRARMMTAQQCLDVLGYAPGGVPPLAHRMPAIATVIDDSLRRYAVVYAAGGAANAIFPIGLETLQRITRADFADLARASKESS